MPRFGKFNIFEISYYRGIFYVSLIGFLTDDSSSFDNSVCGYTAYSFILHYPSNGYLH